jgi:type I restriction enzyme S subunit
LFNALTERFASKTQGVNIYHIGKEGLAEFPIPVAPLPEEKEIIHRIETAFAWLDRIAAEHANASRLLPKLDQAILAKAFRGELVPQDPNDEPAIVLLERIQADQQGAGSLPRR